MPRKASAASSSKSDSRLTIEQNRNLLSQVRIGDEIAVYWPYDAKYYEGKVTRKLPDGRYHIDYEDGDKEDLFLADEQWRFLGNAARRVCARLSANASMETTAPPLDVPSPDEDPVPVRLGNSPSSRSDDIKSAPKRTRTTASARDTAVAKRKTQLTKSSSRKDPVRRASAPTPTSQVQPENVPTRRASTATPVTTATPAVAPPPSVHDKTAEIVPVSTARHAHATSQRSSPQIAKPAAAPKTALADPKMIQRATNAPRQISHKASARHATSNPVKDVGTSAIQCAPSQNPPPVARPPVSSASLATARRTNATTERISTPSVPPTRALVVNPSQTTAATATTALRGTSGQQIPAEVSCVSPSDRNPAIKPAKPAVVAVKQNHIMAGQGRALPSPVASSAANGVRHPSSAQPVTAPSSHQQRTEMVNRAGVSPGKHVTTSESIRQLSSSPRDSTSESRLALTGNVSSPAAKRQKVATGSTRLVPQVVSVSGVKPNPRFVGQKVQSPAPVSSEKVTPRSEKPQVSITNPNDTAAVPQHRRASAQATVRTPIGRSTVRIRESVRTTAITDSTRQAKKSGSFSGSGVLQPSLRSAVQPHVGKAAATTSNLPNRQGASLAASPPQTVTKAAASRGRLLVAPGNVSSTVGNMNDTSGTHLASSCQSRLGAEAGAQPVVRRFSAPAASTLTPGGGGLSGKNSLTPTKTTSAELKHGQVSRTTSQVGASHSSNITLKVDLEASQTPQPVGTGSLSVTEKQPNIPRDSDLPGRSIASQRPADAQGQKNVRTPSMGTTAHAQNTSQFRHRPAFAPIGPSSRKGPWRSNAIPSARVSSVPPLRKDAQGSSASGTERARSDPSSSSAIEVVDLDAEPETTSIPSPTKQSHAQRRRIDSPRDRSKIGPKAESTTLALGRSPTDESGNGPSRGLSARTGKKDSNFAVDDAASSPEKVSSNDTAEKACTVDQASNGSRKDGGSAQDGRSRKEPQPNRKLPEANNGSDSVSNDVALRSTNAMPSSETVRASQHRENHSREMRGKERTPTADETRVERSLAHRNIPASGNTNKTRKDARGSDLQGTVDTNESTASPSVNASEHDGQNGHSEQTAVCGRGKFGGTGRDVMRRSSHRKDSNVQFAKDLSAQPQSASQNAASRAGSILKRPEDASRASSANAKKPCHKGSEKAAGTRAVPSEIDNSAQPGPITRQDSGLVKSGVQASPTGTGIGTLPTAPRQRSAAHDGSKSTANGASEAALQMPVHDSPTKGNVAHENVARQTALVKPSASSKKRPLEAETSALSLKRFKPSANLSAIATHRTQTAGITSASCTGAADPGIPRLPPSSGVNLGHPDRTPRQFTSSDVRQHSRETRTTGIRSLPDNVAFTAARGNSRGDNEVSTLDLSEDQKRDIYDAVTRKKSPGDREHGRETKHASPGHLLADDSRQGGHGIEQQRRRSAGDRPISQLQPVPYRVEDIRRNSNDVQARMAALQNIAISRQLAQRNGLAGFEATGLNHPMAGINRPIQKAVRIDSQGGTTVPPSATQHQQHDVRTQQAMRTGNSIPSSNMVLKPPSQARPAVGRGDTVAPLTAQALASSSGARLPMDTLIRTISDTTRRSNEGTIGPFLSRIDARFDKLEAVTRSFGAPDRTVHIWLQDLKKQIDDRFEQLKNKIERGDSKIDELQKAMVKGQQIAQQRSNGLESSGHNSTGTAENEGNADAHSGPPSMEEGELPTITPLSGSTSVADLPHADSEMDKVSILGRELIGLTIVDWMVGGGCRENAPPNERAHPVTITWVKDMNRKCLGHCLSRLKGFSSYEEARGDLETATSGTKSALSWLTMGPTSENVSEARENYRGWHPKLQDFEWASERRVFASLATELIRTERAMLAARRRTTDALESAVGCVRLARSRMGRCSGEW